jgi:hypothetical protein
MFNSDLPLKPLANAVWHRHLVCLLLQAPYQRENQSRRAKVIDSVGFNGSGSSSGINDINEINEINDINKFSIKERAAPLRPPGAIPSSRWGSNYSI